MNMNSMRNDNAQRRGAYVDARQVAGIRAAGCHRLSLDGAARALCGDKGMVRCTHEDARATSHHASETGIVLGGLLALGLVSHLDEWRHAHTYTQGLGIVCALADVRWFGEGGSFLFEGLDICFFSEALCLVLVLKSGPEWYFITF